MIDEERATYLHETAMGFAQEAMLAQDRDEVLRLSRLAFEHERDAAEMLVGEIKEEPTRSILYRSAATLARDCGDYSEAERLIAAGLSGYPPADVAAELRELWEIIRFDRRLADENIVLEREDFQFTVSGSGIAPGVAGDAFIARYRVVQRIFIRIAEEVLRGGSKLRQKLRESLRFFIVVAEPGSFVVTLRVGHERQLELLPDFDSTAKVIDELIDFTQLFQEGTDADIERRIPGDDYRRDLKQLFDQLSPDGRDVALVGVARERDGELKQAAITHKREMPLEDAIAADRERSERLKRTVFRGKLLYANEMTKIAKIIIQGDDGERFPLMVADASMEDIVKPLWGKRVVAKGRWRSEKSRTPRLLEIYEER